MPWLHLQNLLREELDRLELPELPPPPTVASYLEGRAVLEEEDRSTAAELDAACQQYISTQTWPQLSPLATKWQRLRLAHALEFCEVMRQAPFRSDPRPTNPTVEFLMGWLWRTRGRERAVAAILAHIEPSHSSHDPRLGG